MKNSVGEKEASRKFLEAQALKREIVKEYLNKMPKHKRKKSTLWEATYGFFFDIEEFNDVTVMKELIVQMKLYDDNYGGNYNGYSIQKILNGELFGNPNVLKEIYAKIKELGLCGEDNLKNFTTRKLLMILKDSRRNYCDIIEVQGKYVSLNALRKELSTREHVPSKLEAKAIRQKLAKKNRGGRKKGRGRVK